MKNLIRTIKKATMPKLSPVKSGNRKLLYSLCAALFLLTCSLSTKADNGGGRDSTDLYVLPYTLGFGVGDTTHFEDAQSTSSSPCTNNYGDPYHSGADKWIQINVADDGYLTIMGGTSNFDSVFYLFDSNWNLITSADDGEGSGDNIGHNYLQPLIEDYVEAGTYYLIVDGSDKYVGPPSSWEYTSGDVDVNFYLDH